MPAKTSFAARARKSRASKAKAAPETTDAAQADTAATTDAAAPETIAPETIASAATDAAQAQADTGATTDTTDTTDAPTDAPTDATDKPVTEQAAAPAETTLSARQLHQLAAQAHRQAGADPRNVRDTNRVNVSLDNSKAARKTATGATYAARFNSMPAGTATFILAGRKAYGFEPFNADAIDNGKLARCIGNGLIVVHSGGETYRDASGGLRLRNKPGETLRVRFVNPENDEFHAAEIAAK